MQQTNFAGTGLTERPVLFVGLVGFSPAEEQKLRDAMHTAAPAYIAWRVGVFAEADAWLVNGSSTQVLGSGDLVVAAGSTGGEVVQFRLDEVDRPIAFSEPRETLDFEPACTFNVDSPASIHQVLARCAIWLRPVAGQLCLAAELVRHEQDFSSGSVYHVGDHGRLLAVVNLRGDVGVLPTAVPTQIASAQWRSRPASASYIPEAFQRTTMSALMWQYALRSDRDLLPARYRQKPIHYRRPPRLPHRMLRDSHLLVMRELSRSGAASFEDLLDQTRLEPGKLARDLAALYLVGSITANPARARRVRPSVARVHGSNFTDELRSSDWPSHPGQLPARQRRADPTAPVPMSSVR